MIVDCILVVDGGFHRWPPHSDSALQKRTTSKPLDYHLTADSPSNVSAQCNSRSVTGVSDGEAEMVAIGRCDGAARRESQLLWTEERRRGKQRLPTSRP
jgi:hypothetical protein